MVKNRKRLRNKKGNTRVELCADEYTQLYVCVFIYSSWTFLNLTWFYLAFD